MGIEQRVKRWARRAGKDPISYWKLNKHNILAKADSAGALEYAPKGRRRHGSPSDFRRAKRRAYERLPRVIEESVEEVDLVPEDFIRSAMRWLFGSG